MLSAGNSQSTQPKELVCPKIQDVVEQQVANKAWLEYLQKQGSDAHNLVYEATKEFDKYQQPLLLCMQRLMATDDEMTCEMLLGEPAQIFAIVMQNALHPKNSQRVEAIKAQTYKDLATFDEANAFLAETLSSNLTKDLMSAESFVQGQMAKILQ